VVWEIKTHIGSNDAIGIQKTIDAREMVRKFHSIPNSIEESRAFMGSELEEPPSCRAAAGWSRPATARGVYLFEVFSEAFHSNMANVRGYASISSIS